MSEKGQEEVKAFKKCHQIVDVAFLTTVPLSFFVASLNDVSSCPWLLSSSEKKGNSVLGLTNLTPRV